MAKKKTTNIAITSEDTPVISSSRAWANIMPHLTERGKIIGCIDNLKVLLHEHRVSIRYNVISKQNDIIIPGQSFSIDNHDNAALAWVRSEMNKAGVPTDSYREYLTAIADENQYNPVLQWIESKKWDGKTRIADLCNTITAEDEESKNLFIRRWMIGAVALACSPAGIDSCGILVLQGDQDLGKTWWFRKLVPKEMKVTRADANINPHDKDSVNQAVSNWLVELGELDATFKRAEIAALKGFLTRDFDIYRKPFAAADSKFPRRTAFMASVNPQQYLVDDTGNRRFWTVACKKVDSYHNIDMQQVWAEMYEKWSAGESHLLTAREKELVREINKDHIAEDPIVEIILKKYAWEADEPLWRNNMTATDILHEIGMMRISQRDLRVCSGIVRKMNGNRSTRAKNGRFLPIPPKLTEPV